MEVISQEHLILVIDFCRLFIDQNRAVMKYFAEYHIAVNCGWLIYSDFARRIMSTPGLNSSAPEPAENSPVHQVLS